MVDIDDLFPFNDELGYLGVIILSFVSSIIIFIPVPYIPVLIAATLNNKLDPNIVAISSAAGITAGRSAIFLISYFGRKILKDKTKRRLLPVQRLLSRYGWLGAFLAALTPFPPDDIVIILLGVAKYSPWKFAVASFIGKLIANELIVWGVVLLGRPAIERLLAEGSEPIYIIIVGAISIIVVGLTVYLFLKVDWSKVIGKWFPWAIDGDFKKDR
ncbi:MAG: YqaA family protein [Nitrososphaeraceae archaeon]